VAVILDPGESADIDFTPWTPANLSVGKNETIDYRVTATALNVEDTNPANDVMTSDLTVDFWHDVGVEITEPSIGRDRQVFLGYDDGYTENSWRYTDGSDWSAAIQLTDTQLAPYRGDEITQVKFSAGCDVYGFEVADYEIWISDQLEDPTAPPVVYKTGTSSGTGWDIVTLDMAYVIPNSGDVYLGITYSNYGAGYPAGVDDSNSAAAGFWFYYSAVWQDATPLLGPSVWGLDAGVTEGAPGPPPISLWLAPGTHPVEAIVENLGTYGETGLNCTAMIMEYITDPNGTEVYNDSDYPISVGPLGGTHTSSFDPYNFAVQGGYGLFVECELGTDIDLNNNADELGIGIDNTEPTSTHTLDPPDPTGDGTWYVSDSTVTLEANDGTEEWQSGVDEITYTINGGPPETYTAPFVMDTDGEDIEVEYWAVDNVGNEETPHNTFEIDMDQTDPNVVISYEIVGGNPTNGWDMLFNVTATDATSTMDRVIFYLNNVEQEVVPGEGPIFQWSFTYHGGLVITVKAEGYDDAGNMADDETLVEKGAQSHSQSTQQQAIVQK
jgi:hypothetical protein